MDTLAGLPVQKIELPTGDVSSDPPRKSRTKYLDEKNEKFWGRMGDRALPAAGRHITFAGKTLSGKTCALKEMLKGDWGELFDEIIVFAPTADLETWREDFKIKPENIHSNITRKDLAGIFKYVSEKFENELGLYPHKKLEWSTLLIIDDVAQSMHNWGELTNNLARFRHYGGTIWLCIQYPKFIGPGQRVNIYCSSISPHYVQAKEIDKLSDGNSMIPTRRKLPLSIPVLDESLEDVREINRQSGVQFGRLMYSNVPLPNGQDQHYYYQLGNEMLKLPTRYVSSDDEMPPEVEVKKRGRKKKVEENP